MDKTINYYDMNADAFVESTLHSDMSDMYKIFLKDLKPKAAILDFGCGSGRDSKYFIEHGYNVTAIDGSSELCERAGKVIGQKVYNMKFNELDSKNKYDAVWACASLLHLDKEELKDVFNRLNDALKDEGIIYASFKYGDFSGEKNGRFFYCLTEEKLKDLIKDINNFNVIYSAKTNDVRPGRENEEWLNVIIKKKDNI